MSPIRLNFEGVSTDGFTPWPVNEPQEFTIFAITQEVAKESKNPYLKFEFKQPNGNRKAWRNFSLSPNALWALKKLLVDLGYDEDALEAEFEFDPDEILGRTVWLTFGPEREYNGRMSQEVTKVVGEEPSTEAAPASTRRRKNS